MNTTRYKHGILGLVLLSLMSFDAFAETRVSSLSGYHHSGQLTLDAAYGDKQTSHGTVDLLYPLYQRSDAIGFVDIRGMLREGSASEFNLGGGYRWLNDSQTQLYGAYGFYDAKQSADSKSYTQLTLGGEWKVANYSLGGNVYIPMGSQKNELFRTAKHAELIPTPPQEDADLINLTDDVLYEYAYQGLDVEVGYQVPQLPGLTTYVGAYYFTHKDAEAITGPRLNIEYDVLQHMKQVPSWLDSVDVVASVQHDKVRETLWSIGMRVSIPLGTPTDKRTLTGLKAGLTSVVRRDKDIVTSTSILEEETLFTNDDGTPMKLRLVTTASELQQGLIDGGFDIIVVKDDITIAGKVEGEIVEGLLGETDTPFVESAVVLPDNLTLTGEDVSIEFNDLEYTLPIDTDCIADKCSITLTQEDKAGAFVQTGHLLQVGKNNTLENILLIVPKGAKADNELGQQSAAITNTTGVIQADENLTTEGQITYATYGGNFVPFGNLTLKNVDVRGGGMVYLNVDKNAATESTVTISGGTYTITNPYVGKSYATNNVNEIDDVMTSFGAITLIDQGDGTKLRNHQLSGMTITVTQGIDAEESSCSQDTCREVPVISGVAASHLSEAGSIVNNTISSVSATGAGVSAGGVTAGAVAGIISGNTFDGEITAQGGFYATASGISAGSLSGTILANTFKGAITASNDAVGIAAGDVSGTISDNTFNEMVKGDEAYGMVLVRILSSGAISGNTFDAKIIGTGVGVDGMGFPVAAGIFAEGVKGTIGCPEAIEVACKNKFGVIVATQTQAAGVVLMDDLGDEVNAGHIRGNTFEQIKGVKGLEYFGSDTPNAGIFVIGKVNADSSISGNIFGVKVDGTAATGNAIETTGSDAGVAGIYVYGDVDGAIGCGADLTSTESCANKFGIIESSQEYAAGIIVGHDDDKEPNKPVGGDVNGTINGNTFNGAITGNKGALGISATGTVSGTISGNIFGGTITGTDGAVGIAAGGTVTGTIGCGAGETDTANCKNTFGAISARGSGEDAYGIAVGAYVPAVGDKTEAVIGTLDTTGKINGNEFGAITSALGSAHGIKVFKDTAQGSEINQNTFTGTITSEAAVDDNNNDFMASVITVGHIQVGNVVAGTAAAGTIAGNVAGNTVNAASAIVLSTGITIGGPLTGTIGCSAGETANCANKFSVIESNEGQATGVWVVGDLGGAAGANPGHIRGNTFGQINGAANFVVPITRVTYDVSGIIVSGSVKPGSSISGNAFGVNIDGNPTGKAAIQATGSSPDNDGPTNAMGIYVNTDVAGTIGCASGEQGNCGNTFFAITSALGDAYGLKVTGAFSGVINSNSFTVKADTTKKAYGIFFNKVLATYGAARKVTSNTLDVTHATTPANAIGISLKNTVGLAVMDNVARGNKFNSATIGDDTPANAVESRT